jgi:hypothetical protein
MSNKFPNKGIRRDDWIRTSGPYVPNVVRYRAALHPENAKLKTIFYFDEYIVHGP